MKVKHYIYIKCKARNHNRILVKLYKNKINVYDVIEKDEELYIKVLESDYERIKKEIVTAKFYYVTDSGFFRIKKRITPLKIFAVLLFLFLTNFFSCVIVKVNVIHSNKEIRDLVSKSLEQEGIHVWSIKKDYQELQTIKENILNTYKDRLEWIEIENVGMTYVVRIEERIKKEFNEENKVCHVVASKSGVVDSITSTKGEILVHEGQYVNSGDILISGEIKFNEEVKNNVCASGQAYAEVWYETHVSLPIEYITVDRTGKKRWNLSFESDSGKYKILRSRLNTFETESKVLFHFFNFTFYLDTEYETIETKNTYDLSSGTEKALELADEKIQTKFQEFEKIKSRKVLKNTTNDSTIEVDVFYAVIENISKVEEYTITPIEEEGS